MGANACFFTFVYLVSNTCIYKGKKIMVADKVFQPVGLTKLWILLDRRYSIEGWAKEVVMHYNGYGHTKNQ